MLSDGHHGLFREKSLHAFSLGKYYTLDNMYIDNQTATVFRVII